MFFFFRILIACLFGAGIGSIFSHFSHRSPKAAAVAEVKPLDQKPFTKPAFLDLDQDTQKLADKKKELPEPVRVAGYVVLGKRVNVILTDGRTLTELDPELKNIHRNTVTVGSEKLFMVQAKDKKMTAVPSPVVAPGADQSTAPLAMLPPPPAEPPSSWVMNSDGVSRLIISPKIGN